MSRIRLSLFALLVPVVLLVGCGGDEVAMTEVSHEDTKDMVVWSPGGDGPWPVIYALPDTGIAQHDLDVLAPALADRGFLVIGTNWDASILHPTDSDRDVECGYRYAREIAEDHGGDLSEPVTMLGNGFGGFEASVVGLDSRFGPDGNYSGCFTGTDRPDLVITVGTCHNDYLEYVVTNYNNTDGKVAIITGQDDDVCPASLHVAPMLASLDESGIEATTTEIADASHGELVFHDEDNRWAPLPEDDPVGQDTVDAIAQAIADAR
jgi:hypothetical protein